MSYLKVYSWEHKLFPWQYAVQIKPEHRARLTRELGKRFGLGWIEVVEKKRGGGHASVGTFNSMIALPLPSYRCSLGLIIHELAHVYDYKKFGGRGHRASFKKAVIKLQIEVRTYRLLPVIFAAIRQEQAQARVASAKACASANRRLLRVHEAKEHAKSPAGRLQRVQARAKRLRTRIKRLQTALKKAERQERRLNRVMQPGMGQDRPSVTPLTMTASPC